MYWTRCYIGLASHLIFPIVQNLFNTLNVDIPIRRSWKNHSQRLKDFRLSESGFILIQELFFRGVTHQMRIHSPANFIMGASNVQSFYECFNTMRTPEGKRHNLSWAPAAAAVGIQVKAERGFEYACPNVFNSGPNGSSSHRKVTVRTRIEAREERRDFAQTNRRVKC